MSKSYEKQIKELRAQGLSYFKIQKIVKCSKGTISKYCSNDETVSRTKKMFNDEQIKELNEYLKTHTYEETANYYNVSRSTIRNYSYGKPRNKMSYDELMQYHKEHKRKKRRETKQKCVDYKGGKCQVCGYDKCLKALDFHHINPDEKDFSIGQNNTRYTFEVLKLELDKCILLCRNCHTEVHEDLIDLNEYGLLG